MYRPLAIAAAAVIVMATTAPAPESAIRWDAKNAYVKCEGAIDGVFAWPAETGAACVAMLMCANEAPLSAERRRRLVEQMRRVPHCGEP